KPNGHPHEHRRASWQSDSGRVVLRACSCCPLVQWQDIGLWIREWWFESTGGNGTRALISPMDGLSVPSHGLKLVSGRATRALAEGIAHHLGIELYRVNLGRFADGEISV